MVTRTRLNITLYVHTLSLLCSLPQPLLAIAESGYFLQLLHSFQLLIHYLPYHSTLFYTIRVKRRQINQNK